eukprot:TRINITY_DN32305_c0_g1_i1.p1 TRINITY_DN32305_c0_g1~~TRINITY_DN32305_c0_g1_i1.p1  ORF type:complete len:578 (+),score=109.19 TRINITY_DN32305_c0_g1_i1:42-1736(+)
MRRYLAFGILPYLAVHAARTNEADQEDDALSDLMSLGAHSGDVGQWSPETFDLAVDRSWEDAMVIQEVRRGFNKTLLTRKVEGRPKIGFLFMVKDDIDQRKLWSQFFHTGKQENYAIFIHQWKPGTAEGAEAREFWTHRHGALFIPTVKTGWGQLAGVEFALLWEAMRDADVAQFVLLSEGHVPLKSSDYVTGYLLKEREESKICFNVPENSLSIVSNEITKTCQYRDSLQAARLPAVSRSTKTMLPGRVRKHHQWLVLARRHVVDVIDNAENALRRHLKALARTELPQKGSDPAMLGANDESFIATALLLASEKLGSAQEDSLAELDLAGVKSECTSFIYWRHCFKGTALDEEAWNMTKAREIGIIAKAAGEVQMSDWNDARKSPAKYLNDSPRDFGKSDSKPSAAYLKALVSAGFLFARKFGRDESGHVSDDLARELPLLWSSWDSMDRSPLAAWPVLDVGDSRAWDIAKARIPKGGLSLLDQRGSSSWSIKNAKCCCSSSGKRVDPAQECEAEEEPEKGALGLRFFDPGSQQCCRLSTNFLGCPPMEFGWGYTQKDLSFCR